MRPCAALILVSQFFTGLGIAAGLIPAGPPTTAAIVAVFLLLHGILYSDII